jgi:hypothetical protein
MLTVTLSFHLADPKAAQDLRSQSAYE